MTNKASPWIQTLTQDLLQADQTMAAEQAQQATQLARLTRLTLPQTQAIIDATWLAAWAHHQPTVYPAPPHAIAAKRAFKADATMAGSLLTHASYLPHLHPLPEQDKWLYKTHPLPEDWGGNWHIGAAIFTLIIALRSNTPDWVDADTALEAAKQKWGRRSTIAAAIQTTIQELADAQATIQARAQTSAWDTIINGEPWEPQHETRTQATTRPPWQPIAA